MENQDRSSQKRQKLPNKLKKANLQAIIKSRKTRPLDFLIPLVTRHSRRKKDLKGEAIQVVEDTEVTGVVGAEAAASLTEDRQITIGDGTKRHLGKSYETKDKTVLKQRNTLRVIREVEVEIMNEAVDKPIPSEKKMGTVDKMIILKIRHLEAKVEVATAEVTITTA